MDSVRNESYRWKLHVRYKKGTGGKLVGQCLDLPFITVRGNTPDEVVQRIYKDIDTYFTTFPDKAEQFLQKNATLVKSEVIVGVQDNSTQDLPAAKQEWQEKELLCTARA